MHKQMHKQKHAGLGLLWILFSRRIIMLTIVVELRFFFTSILTKMCNWQYDDMVLKVNPNSLA